MRWYGQDFPFWKSRDIGGKIKTGALIQDARGRWYVTFHCEIEETFPTGGGSIGIDLGTKNSCDPERRNDDSIIAALPKVPGIISRRSAGSEETSHKSHPRKDCKRSPRPSS
jgi:hypothetical protein